MATGDFYYSRWKGPRWRRPDDPRAEEPYEIFLHHIHVEVDTSGCRRTEDPGAQQGAPMRCTGEAVASLTFTSTVGRVGVLSGRAIDSGIWLGGDAFHRVQRVQREGQERGERLQTGDQFRVEVDEILRVPCDGADEVQFAYTLLPLDHDEEPTLQYHHYRAKLRVAIVDCGEDCTVTFEMGMIDETRATAEEKYVTELTGPDDPNRAPRQ